MRVRWLGLALSLLVAACSTPKSYIYQPAVQANAQANGFPAAYFQIPPSDPTGDVRIASFGVTDLQPNDGGPKSPALQIRMIISNNQDDSPWAVDTREVVIALAGDGTSRPAFVNTDAGKPPLLQVARGQKATVDLYYPLPPAMKSADKLPSFDLLWQVTTGTGPVAQRTPFEREEIQRPYAYGYPYPYGYPYYYAPYGPYGVYPNYYGPYGLSLGFGIGWGPYWWYDGGYPYHGFYPGVVGPGHPPSAPMHVIPHAGYGGYPGPRAPAVGGSGGHGAPPPGAGHGAPPPAGHPPAGHPPAGHPSGGPPPGGGGAHGGH